MAPVTFFRNTPSPVQPYHISPWQDEHPSPMPAPVLGPLRGDFFCLPFGGNNQEVAGEKHPPHGEIAGDQWTLVGKQQDRDISTIEVEIQTHVRKGSVRRLLSLVLGQNAVYSKTLIQGFSGRVPLGHHATLAMPEKEGSVRIATSPLRFGMTYPGLFSDPKQREYQALQPGAKWTDLAKVPVAWKGRSDADLTRLPVNPGHADLVQVVNEKPSTKPLPAWTTATFQEKGYVWYSLKDPTVLNSTVFWMEFHGRHGHPWNGRNNCVGLEDVTASFADGLAESIQENALSKEGVATSVELNPNRPTPVNYIQGVVRIPEGFENIKTLEFAPGSVTFVSTTGQRVSAPIRHEFLFSGNL